MIVLNTENGIVRLQSWSDIEDRPAFCEVVEARAFKLKAVLGRYHFDTLRPCCLSSCRTDHGKGYLLQGDSGVEIRIGKDCGKTHFKLDFEAMVRKFDRDLARKENAETVRNFQFRLDGVREQLRDLREEERGANWARKLSQYLVEPLKGLDGNLIRRLGDMIKRGTADIVITRRASSAEQKLAEAQAGRKLQPQYKDERMGTVAGLGFFSPDLDLRKIIVDDIEPHLKVIAEIDVQKARDKDIADAARWIGRYEGKLAQIRSALELAAVLLTKGNLAPLVHFIESPEGRKTWKAFIEQLPDRQ